MIRELENLYTQINSKGKIAIRSGAEKIDPTLQDIRNDGRRGLSLLINIPDSITEAIQMIQNEIHRIEPDQYFYPKDDLHLTVLTFISAVENFWIGEDSIERYRQLIQKAIKGIRPFSIKYQGIILSEAAIMMKGYYERELQSLRDKLRINAAKADIILKERYQSISAHSTIVRFQKNLQNKNRLLAIIEEYQNYYFGTVNVAELDLVVHDWYNSKKEMNIKINM